MTTDSRVLFLDRRTNNIFNLIGKCFSGCQSMSMTLSKPLQNTRQRTLQRSGYNPQLMAVFLINLLECGPCCYLGHRWLQPLFNISKTPKLVTSKLYLSQPREDWGHNPLAADLIESRSLGPKLQGKMLGIHPLLGDHQSAHGYKAKREVSISNVTVHNLLICRYITNFQISSAR